MTPEWPEELREAMRRPMYYRRDGTPYQDRPGLPATIQWAEDHSKFENCRVCFTKFWWGGELSTVWLGLDHSFGGGPPLIFETILFGWPYQMDLMDTGNFREVHPDFGCWRHSTVQDAIVMHSELVREYKFPWRRLAGFAWEWFKDWERQDAKRRNCWSLFTPFMWKEFKTHELIERLSNRRESEEA